MLSFNGFVWLVVCWFEMLCLISEPCEGVIAGSEIRFVAPSASVVGTAWYAREGEDVIISCFQPFQEKYIGAMFLWTDEQQRGILRHGVTLYDNGSFRILDLTLDDSARLTCDVTRPDGEEETYVHSIIEEPGAQKAEDLLEFLCGTHYDDETCPFKTRRQCSPRPSDELLNDASEGRFVLRITVEQYPAHDYHVPRCNLWCMKKSIAVHLIKQGDHLLSALVKREEANHPNLSQLNGFNFQLQDVFRQRIRSRCAGGYEINQRIICVPCVPGTYMRFKTLYTTDRENLAHCQPCPLGRYQSEFGENECEQCPTMGVTKQIGADTITKCVATNLDIAMAYTAAEVAIVIVVFIFCFCVGLSIYRSRSTAQQRYQSIAQAYSPPPVNFQTPRWSNVNANDPTSTTNNQQHPTQPTPTGPTNVNFSALGTSGTSTVVSGPILTTQPRLLLGNRTSGHPLLGDQYQGTGSQRHPQTTTTRGGGSSKTDLNNSSFRGVSHVVPGSRTRSHSRNNLTRYHPSGEASPCGPPPPPPLPKILKSNYPPVPPRRFESLQGRLSHGDPAEYASHPPALLPRDRDLASIITGMSSGQNVGSFEAPRPGAAPPAAIALPWRGQPITPPTTRSEGWGETRRAPSRTRSRSNVNYNRRVEDVTSSIEGRNRQRSHEREEKRRRERRREDVASSIEGRNRQRGHEREEERRRERRRERGRSTCRRRASSPLPDDRRRRR